MSNFSDEDDARICAEFWDYLNDKAMLSSQQPAREHIAVFLAARREKREKEYR